jgi:hypothetical protein
MSASFVFASEEVMARGNWIAFAEGLVERVRKEGPIEMSIDEIIQATGTQDKSVRQRDWWRASQSGDQHSDSITRYGLKIEFRPDVAGRDVEMVTFRL